LDGSAAGFVEAIKEAGIIEQDAQRREIKVDKEISCRHKDSLITVLPDECFRISYTLEYKDISIGRQDLSITVDRKSFEESIAPARTFCLKKEALMLRMLGLGKGADYSNTLVIGKNGPLNNEFRFPDEPVRHKILDLIGDLYTLGMPVKGRFVCVKSGHRLNAQIVEKIRNSKLSSK
jgi:UDP-3-O-acyl N-acetylglucosamine deacetylase